MANEVRITVGADTSKADKAVKGFRQRLDGISKNAKVAGASLSVMGAGGVVAIKGFADAALEQEKAVSTLSAVMDNAGESFGSMEGQIMATTAALQKKTNFGDEAQLRALAKLVPVLGSTELALAALPAAMDVASLTGRDLGSVIDTMGPALAGVTNRIRGTALEFTEAMTPMERINMVLADLGGAAEANANPFTQMSNAIGDVKESIGAQLLPILEPLLGHIQNLAERLQTLDPRFVKIAALALAGATALGVIGGPILLLIGFLPALITGFAALSAAMGPITLIVLGLAAAIAAGILIWKNWGKIVGFFTETLEAPKGIIIGWKESITEAVTAVADTLVNIGVAAFDKVRDAMALVASLYQTNWSWILPGGALMNAILILRKHFEDDVIGVLNKVQEIAVSVGEAVKGKFDEIVGKVGHLGNALKEKLKTPMEAMRDFMVEAFDTIAERIQIAANRIGDIIEGIKQKISALVSTITESKIAGLLMSGLGKGKGLLDRVGDFLGEETAGLAHGGFIKGPEGAPRLAMVHGGELVLNRAQQAAVGNTMVASQPGPMTIQVFLDGALVGSGIGRMAKHEEQVRSS